MYAEESTDQDRTSDTDRRLAVNRCCGVEFPVAVSATTRKPNYLSASEQRRLEEIAPIYLRNIVVIMVEMG